MIFWVITTVMTVEGQ